MSIPEPGRPDPWEGDGSGGLRCSPRANSLPSPDGDGRPRIPSLRQLRHKDDACSPPCRPPTPDCAQQGCDLAGETRLAEAVAALLQRCTATALAGTRGAAEPAKVRRVRQYLHDRFDRRLRLRELANLAGLNPVYLVRAFRSATGLPPHAYQRQLRINRAQVLLRRGESPANVAAATGFADQSHLTRTFRNALGITPAAYAKG